VVAGQGWPQLGTDEYPWHPRTRTFATQNLLDWSEAHANLSAALAAFART
jgi:hypothetical protein